MEISVAWRLFLIRAKDFLRVAECNEDFVAPASYYIPLWAAGLVTPFVTPALRENTFWSCVLDCGKREIQRIWWAGVTEWRSFRRRPKADQRARWNQGRDDEYWALNLLNWQRKIDHATQLFTSEREIAILWMNSSILNDESRTT